MTQAINQFGLAVVQGQMDLQRAKNVIAARVDVTSAGGLVPGQAVKMIDSAGGIPAVVECAADSDDVIGFIAYDLKKSSYAVGDTLQIVTGHDDVMYMAAAGAISRGKQVTLSNASIQVGQAVGASGKAIVGYALDKAVNAGDLVRICIQLPGFAKA